SFDASSLSSAVIRRGESTGFRLDLTSLNSFTGSVTLSFSTPTNSTIQPPTIMLNPTSVPVPADGTANAVMTVSANATTTLRHIRGRHPQPDRSNTQLDSNKRNVEPDCIRCKFPAWYHFNIHHRKQWKHLPDRLHPSKRHGTRFPDDGQPRLAITQTGTDRPICHHIDQCPRLYRSRQPLYKPLRRHIQLAQRYR